MTHDAVRELALDVAGLLDMQKAEDVCVFEVEELTTIAEYFVISTGRNARHLKALSRDVQGYIEKHKSRVIGVEGDPESGWMLIDTGDIVVHLFDSPHRDVYNLEILWGDAKDLLSDSETN